MRLQDSADKGIALKKRVASLEQAFQFLDVERLQVSAHVKNGISMVQFQRLDLVSRPKMIVISIDFTRTRRAAVKQHELPEPVPDLRVEPGQRPLEGALPNARWPAQNHEASRRVVVITHRETIDVHSFAALV